MAVLRRSTGPTRGQDVHSGWRPLDPVRHRDFQVTLRQNDTRPSRLLTRHREAVSKVFATYPGARGMGFRLGCRGDDTSDSEIYLVLDLQPGTAFADYMGLVDDLGEVLRLPVDIRGRNRRSTTGGRLILILI